MSQTIEQERGIYTGSSENSFKSLEQINPGERRMEAFKDIQTAVDLMTDYV